MRAEPEISPDAQASSAPSCEAGRRYRVLIVAAHPVQYAAPYYRRLAQHPKIDLLVAYCRLRGAEEDYDPEFATKVKWDVPLLDGYQWVHVPNKGSGSEGFWGLTNPGLWKLIRDGNFNAVFCYTGYIRASFWIARLRAWLSGVPFIFGADSATLDSLDTRWWKPWAKRILWPWLFRTATQVIVPGTNGRELMLSLGIPAERVSLTPSCVENDWWLEQSAKVNRDEARAAWGVPHDAVVILFCFRDFGGLAFPSNSRRIFRRSGQFSHTPHPIVVWRS